MNDKEAMSQPYILNDLLEAMDAYDEDAQAANFLLQQKWIPLVP